MSLPSTNLKDLLTQIGVFLGIVAAILSIIEHVFRYRKRLNRKKKDIDGQEAKAITKKHFLFPHLVRKEILIILTSGILINAVGLILTERLKSVFYFDMIGTAAVSYLLGPWWGAITGLISNSVFNYYLYMGENPDKDIFIWLIINVLGGIYWGYLARNINFKKYSSANKSTVTSNILYLFKHGIMAAMVMSIPGTIIKLQLNGSYSVLIDDSLSAVINKFLLSKESSIKHLLNYIVSENWSQRITCFAISYVQTCIKYIPDKAISGVMGILIIKYCFPLYERELITRKTPFITNKLIKSHWSEPLIFTGLYLIPCIRLLYAFERGSIWLLFTFPILLALLIFFLSLKWGIQYSEMLTSLRYREKMYTPLFEPSKDMQKDNFINLLIFCLLFVSFYITVFLVLSGNFYTVVFNFFFLGYSFLFLIYLFRQMILQNEITLKQSSVQRTIDFEDDNSK